AAALAPGFHGVYFSRGLAYFQQKDYTAAAADFGRAIERGGGTVDAYNNRALARERLGRYPEAVPDANEAPKKDTSVTLLFFLRHRLRLHLKDPRAAEDLEEGLRRTPGNDVRSWNALGNAYLRQADNAPRFGAFEAMLALIAFEHGLAVDPEHLETLISKAFVLGRGVGRPREACAVMDRLVQLYPEYAIGLSGRGVLHARLGNRAAALADARRALQFSNSPYVVYQVGDIYALTSRQEPADADHAFV